MNSKSIGSDIVYAWKNAKIGVMEAAPAVKIMYADEIAKADNAAALINEKAAQYNEMQGKCTCGSKERICRRYHRGFRDKTACSCCI